MLRVLKKHKVNNQKDSTKLLRAVLVESFLGVEPSLDGKDSTGNIWICIVNH